MKTALLSLVALAALASAKDDDQVKKGMKALAGTWQYTSQTDNGKEADKEKLKAVTLTITADGKWEAKHEGTVFLEGTVKIDPAKKPKTADWTIATEGCFALEKRPEKFESKEGSKVTNAVLARVKK
jgi:uncharacterized protein (TIGR03067 family)